MTADRYYGFQETAELCEHVITSLFSVSSSSTVEVSNQGLDTPPASPTSKDSPPPLAEFIAYALYRTRLPISITHQALLLLSRLKTRYPSARGTSTSPHRLFLSSLMLSSKISMDDTYSNKSWQVVGQSLFALREVNQMERELFAFLGWNVVVRDEELAAWVSEVVTPYEFAKGNKVLALAAAATIVPTKAISVSSEDRKRRRAAAEARAISTASRSPSPEDIIRQQNAADAASALLRQVAPISTINKQPRPRSYVSRSTSYSSESSSSSSTFSSPPSGSRTPDSPTTPSSEGPLTPNHCDNLASPPSWNSYGKKSSISHEGHVAPKSDSVEIATW